MCEVRQSTVALFSKDRVISALAFNFVKEPWSYAVDDNCRYNS